MNPKFGGYSLAELFSGTTIYHANGAPPTHIGPPQPPLPFIVLPLEVPR